MKKIIALLMLLSSFSIFATECFIGEVRLFAGNFAPRNWALANGQLLAISQNSALFSILGTQYGGDGRTTFALPDLRGRVAVGSGRGPGLPLYRNGQKGGSEQVSLTTQNLPTSGFTALVEALEMVDVAWARKGKANDVKSVEVPLLQMTQNQVDVTLNGGSQPIVKRDPYSALNYIICLRGIFPSRS